MLEDAMAMANHTRKVRSFDNGEREPRFFVREIFDHTIIYIYIYYMHLKLE